MSSFTVLVLPTRKVAQSNAVQPRNIYGSIKRNHFDEIKKIHRCLYLQVVHCNTT